jgi:hypothetical protein
MVIKETRGRKRKYNFNLKKGQVVSQTFSNGARRTALQTAKNKGWKFRTWKENDFLFIARVL